MPLLNPDSYGAASGWAMQPAGATNPPPTQQQQPQQQDWRQKVLSFMVSIGVPVQDIQNFSQFMASSQNPGVVQNIKDAYGRASAQAAPAQPAPQTPTINTRLTPQQIQDIVGNQPPGQ